MIQEEDANYLNRKRGRDEPKIEPIHDWPRCIPHTLTRLQAAAYGKKFSVGKGMEASSVDAGHLLGSAMVSVSTSKRLPGEKRLTFTGDVGRPGLPILRDPEPVPLCDLLISESTYGGHMHEPVTETADKLGKSLCAERRRIAAAEVIIPAFAVGRTQTVVYFLHQLISAGKLPNIPIFVDSPMATRASEVFREHPECFDEETLALLQSQPDLFGESRVHYVESVNESVKLNYREGPCIVISSSGMCEAGRVLHHLKHGLSNPANTILIAGYQAQDTLGHRIVEKRPEVRVLGRMVPVKAEIVVLNGLSSHADHGDLMRMLGPLASNTRTACSFGEPDRAAEASRRAEGLRLHGCSYPRPRGNRSGVTKLRLSP